MSVAELADKVGCSQVFVTKIENEQKRVSEKILENLKLILSKKEIDEIIEYETYIDTPDSVKQKMQKMEKQLETQIKGNTKIITDDDFIELPVRAKASAGNGYINLEECLYRTKIRKNGYSKDCYIIEVVGESMEPLIQEGAYVIVDPQQTSYIKDKVYVVKFEEETYVKKVEIDEKSNLMILKSVNPDYENKYIHSSESHLVKILGRAIAYTYEGKL